MRKIVFPGYLYAKSFLRGGKKTGYARYFVHDSLRCFLGEIEQLREDFNWSVESDGEYKPVACYKSIGDGESLVARFFDDGLDEFLRPHTIRMEVLRAKDSELPIAVDCESSCMPDLATKEYAIESTVEVGTQLKAENSWTFVGDAGTFSCGRSGTKNFGYTVTAQSPSSIRKNASVALKPDYGSLKLILVVFVFFVCLVSLCVLYFIDKLNDLENEFMHIRADFRKAERRCDELGRRMGEREVRARSIEEIKESIEQVKKDVEQVKQQILDVSMD